jgi:molybdopterin molybdotransferase
MERLVAFDSVRQQLLAQCPAIEGVDEIPLAEAAGRCLGSDVVAADAYPSVALAATDGVAVRAEDSVGASPYNPLPVSAGASVVEPGDDLPAGTDAVAPWETLEAAGDSWTLLDEVDAGQGVCRPGQLLRAGTAALAAGRCLKAADLALLADLGHDRVRVRRKPVVQVLYLRTEADSLRLLLQPLLAADGAEIRERSLGAGDDVAAALGEAGAAADLVLVVGGAGEGPGGVAPQAVTQAGTLHVHHVALRPGRAAGVGVIDGTAVLLVPAEPVAACAIADLLAGPAVRALGGRDAGLPHGTWTAPLARKLVSSLGEVGYVRAAIDGEQIRPQPTGTDLDLPALSRTDGFILVDPDSEGYPPGTAVTLYRDRC